MARALADIMTELNSVYNPQRTRQQDMYSQGMAAVDPMQSADLAGLEAAKKDSFNQIETGANRRGMLFSGIPLAEQAKYVGQNYLPSVANLQNRYATIKGNLYQTLAGALGNLDTEQRKFGQDIYGQEVNQDLQREQAAATRATAASSVFTPSGGGDNTPTQTATPFQTYLQSLYAANPTATRAQQDQWVQQYNTTHGITNPSDVSAIYAAYDTWYPWAQNGGGQSAPAAPQPAVVKIASSAIKPVTSSPYVSKPFFGQ